MTTPVDATRMDVAGLVERLSTLLAKATPGPWAYRLQEHDDWGMIRTTVPTDDGWHPVVARAKDVGHQSDEDYARHRREKTDPTEANALLITEAVNALPTLLAALTKAAPPVEAAERVRSLIAELEALTPDELAFVRLTEPAKKLLAALQQSQSTPGAGEECDVCHGSGKRTNDQLWPDYPPRCAYCEGTGRLATTPVPLDAGGALGDLARNVLADLCDRLGHPDTAEAVRHWDMDDMPLLPADRAISAMIAFAQERPAYSWETLRDIAESRVRNGSGFHLIDETAWRELAAALHAAPAPGGEVERLAKVLIGAWDQCGEVPFPLYDKEAEAMVRAILAASRLSGRENGDG